MKPFFSIVVPTTRPHYLPTALTSVFAQTFEDFEVVVSDNTTEGLANRFPFPSDARLRVVRPDEPMKVAPHWDFAFSHARGRWRLMLCDDDALVPQALACLRGLIARHPDIEAIRYCPMAFTPDAPLTLRLPLPNFSGRVDVTPSEPLLRSAFSYGSIPYAVKKFTPHVPNTAIAETLDARMRDTAGGAFFRPFDPMTSMSLFVLKLTASFLRIDSPLVLFGNTFDSAGRSIAQAGTPSSTFEATNGTSQVLHAPIKSRRLFHGLKSDTMLDLQKNFPALFGDCEFNWAGYFHFCAASIDSLAATGVDVSEERRMYDAAVAAAMPGMREAVLAFIPPSLEAPAPTGLARLGNSIGYRVKKLAARPVAAPTAADLASIATAAAFVGRRYEKLLN
jgi:hypothetical protein